MVKILQQECMYMELSLLSSPCFPTLSVRVYDLVLLFFSLVFLGYLLIRLVSTVKKLRDSLPLFRVLYFMVCGIYINSTQWVK